MLRKLSRLMFLLYIITMPCFAGGITKDIMRDDIRAARLDADIRTADPSVSTAETLKKLDSAFPTGAKFVTGPGFQKYATAYNDIDFTGLKAQVISRAGYIISFSVDTPSKTVSVNIDMSRKDVDIEDCLTPEVVPINKPIVSDKPIVLIDKAKGPDQAQRKLEALDKLYSKGSQFYIRGICAEEEFIFHEKGDPPALTGRLITVQGRKDFLITFSVMDKGREVYFDFDLEKFSGNLNRFWVPKISVDIWHRRYIGKSIWRGPLDDTFSVLPATKNLALFKITSMDVYEDSCSDDDRLFVFGVKTATGQKGRFYGNFDLHAVGWFVSDPHRIYPRWKKSVWRDIENRYISIGMSKDQVLLSWGTPSDINRSTYQWGTEEQWVYGNGYYVYFKNGKVDAIQD